MIMQNLKKEILRVLLLVFIGLFLFADLAQAYIDLGSGSYLFQMLIAALFGIFFTAKVYWKKIKVFFSHYFLRNKDKNRE